MKPASMANELGDVDHEHEQAAGRMACASEGGFTPGRQTASKSRGKITRFAAAQSKFSIAVL
jgi:hypothetical protein